MSTPNSSRSPANLEQQRTLAKDLIRGARDGDTAALSRIRAVRPDATGQPRSLALADAQLAVAREGGFESWPKLVADLQERDVKAFCEAVRGEDIPRTEQLLASTHVRIRDGQQPLHEARAATCAGSTTGPPPRSTRWSIARRQGSDPSEHAGRMGCVWIRALPAAGADYPAVVDRLVAAGADIRAVGNGAGRLVVAMAPSDLRESRRTIGVPADNVDPLARRAARAPEWPNT